jgi:hypothetical protein
MSYSQPTLDSALKFRTLRTRNAQQWWGPRIGWPQRWLRVKSTDPRLIFGVWASWPSVRGFLFRAIPTDSAIRNGRGRAPVSQPESPQGALFDCDQRYSHHREPRGTLARFQRLPCQDTRGRCGKATRRRPAAPGKFHHPHTYPHILMRPTAPVLPKGRVAKDTIAPDQSSTRSKQEQIDERVVHENGVYPA